MTLTEPQANLVEACLDLAAQVANKICAKNRCHNKWYNDIYSVCLESLCKSAQQWDGRGSFRAYAGQQMHYDYWDWVRVTTKKGRDKPESYEALSEVPDLNIEPSYEDQYDVLIADSLKQHLGKLSERDRQVLIDFADYDINYAARKHGLTKGRVSQIRSKARQQWQGKNGG